MLCPDVSKCMWNGVGQNEGELPCMFEENTPLKACGDLPYHATSSGIYALPNFCYQPCGSFMLQISLLNRPKFKAYKSDWNKLLADYMNKDLDLFRENSSQIKRRRMLQFDPEVFNAPLCNEDISASFLQSEVGKALIFSVAWNFSIICAIGHVQQFFLSQVSGTIYPYALNVAHLDLCNNGAICYFCL